MTDHDKLVNAALNQDVKSAAATFVEELIASTMLAVRRDPRAYGFVTLKEHDARVTELLEANNREVERRRAAEAHVRAWEFDVQTTIRSMPLGCGNEAAAAATSAAVADGRCSECNIVAACVVTCGQRDCPVIAARKAAA